MSTTNTFKTGEKAPFSGTYQFVRHTDSTTCIPTEDEKLIPLSEGETFPPCKSCNSGAYWALVHPD
jgi:YjzC-like protein